MRYKLVIFDLDGTVLNTLGGLTYAVNNALAMNDLPEISESKVKAMIGNGTRKLIERALNDVGADEGMFDKVFADYKEFYAKNCSHETFPYDGIMTLLEGLNSRGVKCAVVTNKPDLPAKILISKNFGELICETHGNVPDVPVKPDPTFVYKTMENVGVKPSDAVYIGDSDVDIRTGRNAGIDFISVDWGFRTREFLIQNGAGLIFSDPAKLLEYLSGD
ncbi:MAG: HAD-IA family hydrolase [Clostridiales bacterium]|nr:HAD-IA family hydrolase [Clostridiales bacterium]